MPQTRIVSLFPALGNHHAKLILPFVDEVIRSLDGSRDSTHVLMLYDKAEDNWKNVFRDSLSADVAIEFVPKDIWALEQALLRVPPDLLIVHSAFFPDLWRVFLLLPHLRERTIWMIWGGDLGDFTNKITFVGVRTWLTQVLDRAICRRVFPRLGQIGALVPEDGRTLQRVYPKCQNVTRLVYPLMDDGIAEAPKSARIDAKPLRVLCGNSAFANNNHAEIIAWVEHLNRPGVEWIFPLSYGPRSVSEEIAALGQARLGDNFRPLLELIPLAQYQQLLDGCDVLIFNHTQRNQQGLGNLYHLLPRGRKIFIRGDNTLTAELKSWGCHIWDTLQLEQMTWERFSAPLTKAEATANWAAYQKHASRSVARQRWRDTLSKLLDRSAQRQPTEITGSCTQLTRHLVSLMRRTT